MQNRKPLLETFETSSKLLWWFVQKVNFKIWSLLWLPMPKLNWHEIGKISLRTFQLIMAVPAIIIDLLIILSAVILYILSILMILLFFILYAIFVKIFTVIMDKAVSPIFKIFGIAIALTALYLIYKPEAWHDISSRLSELYSLFS